MIQELQTGILDINNRYGIDFTCKQLDDVILKIIVYDKSVPADLGNYTCRLKAFKTDQVPLIQNTNITIVNNVAEIKASKQLTTTLGIVKAELQFINKSTLEKKSTFYINIEVVASVLDVDGTVSTPTCTILEEIDHKLDQIENIGEVLDEAKEVRDTLTNTTIPGATSINSTLESNIKNASNKIVEVESSITNASKKTEEVEASTKNANSSKEELDLSKTNADTTKENLDTANVQAERNIEELNKLGDVTELAKNVQTNTTDITNLKEDVENNTSQLKDIMNSGYFDIAKDAKGADYKTIRDSGLYRNVTGIPTTIGGGILQVIVGQDKWGIAYRWYHIANSVVTEYISCKDGDNFEGWKQLATVDDTGWIDISSTINSKATGTAKIRRICNEVFFEIRYKGIINENEIVATMPAEYAPKRQSEYVFCRFPTGIITLDIQPNGRVMMDYQNTGTQKPDFWCSARTSYLID